VECLTGRLEVNPGIRREDKSNVATSLDRARTHGPTQLRGERREARLGGLGCVVRPERIHELAPRHRSIVIRGEID
jgi:hypothetical protein